MWTVMLRVLDFAEVRRQSSSAGYCVDPHQDRFQQSSDWTAELLSTLALKRRFDLLFRNAGMSSRSSWHGGRQQWLMPHPYCGG